MSNKDNYANTVLDIGQIDMCEEQMKIEDEELAFEPSEIFKHCVPLQDLTPILGEFQEPEYDWGFFNDKDSDDEYTVAKYTAEIEALKRENKRLKYKIKEQEEYINKIEEIAYNLFKTMEFGD